MKITVYSRGKTQIDADTEYQDPMIREAIDQRGDVAGVIVDYTETERSGITCDDYAIVTGDNGRELWHGWLTGNRDAPPPGEALTGFYPLAHGPAHDGDWLAIAAFAADEGITDPAKAYARWGLSTDRTRDGWRAVADTVLTLSALMGAR
jgi:hypothetical protein